MKKLVKLFVAVVMLSMLMNCNKSEEEIVVPEDAVVTISLGSDYVTVLDKISFDVDATSPLGVLSAEGAIYLGTESLFTFYDQGKDSLKLSIDESFTYDIPKNAADQTLTFVFSLTDTDGRIAGDTLSLFVEGSGTVLHSNVIIGSFGHLDLGSYYDAIGNQLYFEPNIRTSKDKKSSIDFLFYNSDEYGYTLAASISDSVQSEWELRMPNTLWPLVGLENATSFYPVPATTNFDSLTTGVELISLISGLDSLVEIIGIEAGTMYGVKLDDSREGRYGLLKVNDVTGKEWNEAQISFDLRLQE